MVTYGHSKWGTSQQAEGGSSYHASDIEGELSNGQPPGCNTDQDAEVATSLHRRAAC